MKHVKKNIRNIGPSTCVTTKEPLASTLHEAHFLWSRVKLTSSQYCCFHSCWRVGCKKSLTIGCVCFGCFLSGTQIQIFRFRDAPMVSTTVALVVGPYLSIHLLWSNILIPYVKTPCFEAEFLNFSGFKNWWHAPLCVYRGGGRSR